MNPKPSLYLKNNKAYKLFLKALSNDTRLEILDLLKNETLTVTEICKQTDFEQIRVSHSLKYLECCGFVLSEKSGKWKRYSLEKETILPILKLLDEHLSKYYERLEKCSKETE